MNSFDEAIERPHYYVITSPINSKELFITIYLIGPESQYEVYFKTRQDSCASDGFAGFFPLPQWSQALTPTSGTAHGNIYAREGKGTSARSGIV